MKFRSFEKKGQVTMWVIIAISIAVFILLLFILVKKPYSTNSKEFDPQSYIEKCARKYINEATDQMIPQGGFLSPTNYKLYKNNKVSYLCLNINYYEPCINQHPMLLNEMKSEIYNYVSPKIEECFADLKVELEKRKYVVDMTPTKLKVDMGPKRVYLEMDKEITLSKDGQSQKIDELKVEVLNPIYDLGLVAIEIASQEAKYCYFEYVGYMLLYSRYDIDVNSMSDSTKIYNIRDKYTNKQMNIAIRSCAIRPGIL